MDTASMGQGFEKGGFSGPVFTDKKGNGAFKANPVRVPEHPQVKRIKIRGWKFFTMDINLF
jgi:hypothetical protein